jgi:glycosyltransferase involved in cell wall biosynthesis
VRIANPRTRVVAAVYDIESTLAIATGLISSRRFASLLGAIEAWCLNRADTLLVLTPQMHQHLESIGVTRPISVVPIWPSITGVAQTTERVHMKTLMYTGGLARRHGIHVLPELWRHLQRKVPECRLILQGEDSQMGDTKKVLHAIGGHVSFRPTVHRDLLLRALQDGDLQLVLTLETGADACIPSKAITSLAAGVPFLTNAPPNSALAEFATKSGGGYVVPCGSPEALASAAAELLRAPGQLAEMGSSGHSYVQKIHSRDNILPHYLGLLRNKVD